MTLVLLGFLFSMGSIYVSICTIIKIRRRNAQGIKK